MKPFLPVANRGSLASLPLGGVVSYPQRCCRAGLSRGRLESEATVKPGSHWECRAAASEEESRAVTGCLSPKRMEGGRRVTAEGLTPH